MALFKTKKLLAASVYLMMAASFVSADFVLDNFDDGNGTSNLESYWYFYTDVGNNGTSKVAGVAKDPPFAGNYEGKDGTYGVQMDFSLGDSTGMGGVKPYVAFETEFKPGDVIDFTGATSVKFDLKASAKMTVQFAVPTAEVSNLPEPSKYNFFRYKALIELPNVWKTYEVLLTKDLTAGLSQEAWGTKAAFNPASIQKFLFRVRGDENPELMNKSGTLSIDNVVLVGNPKNLKRYGQIDTVAPGSYTGKGLLSNFDGELPAIDNTLGRYWYKYTDADIGGTSNITRGLIQEELSADETGGINGGGLSISFVLGNKIPDASGNKIVPFVGLGTELGTQQAPYDARSAGATGLYVEYKSDSVFVDVEIEDYNPRLGGVVWFSKLPPTGGQWRGAKIYFDKLTLTSWALDKGIDPIDISNLVKINFKISDEAIKEGSVALDNVFLMGANISQDVVSPMRKVVSNGISIVQTNNVLTVNFSGKAVQGDAKVNLCNPLGKVVASGTISSGHTTCTFPLVSNANGVYLLNVVKSNGITETTPVHLFK